MPGFTRTPSIWRRLKLGVLDLGHGRSRRASRGGSSPAEKAYSHLPVLRSMENLGLSGRRGIPRGSPGGGGSGGSGGRQQHSCKGPRPYPGPEYLRILGRTPAGVVPSNFGPLQIPDENTGYLHGLFQTGWAGPTLLVFLARGGRGSYRRLVTGLTLDGPGDRF